MKTYILSAAQLDELLDEARRLGIAQAAGSVLIWLITGGFSGFIVGLIVALAFRR
jgi:hypothetical protein